MQISTKEGLRESLQRAIERAQIALLRGVKDTLLGTQLAESALEGAVQAVENARGVYFEISREDEHEFQRLVTKLRALAGLLLSQIEQRNELQAFSLWPALYSGSGLAN